MLAPVICDAVRTPIGRYGGALASVRADDLAAIPLAALMTRNPSVDWAEVDDLIYGCANRAGEDNRNVGRMAVLLAGLPIAVPATTINRRCGSGVDAVGQAARAIRVGDCEPTIAGGVERMTRAPLEMPKAESAFSRVNAVYDTTIGWRFVNPRLKAAFGVDSMPQAAHNVAVDFGISRADQETPSPRGVRPAGRPPRRRAASRTTSCRSRSRRKRARRSSSTPTSTRARAQPPRCWRSCAASTALTSASPPAMPWA